MTGHQAPIFRREPELAVAASTSIVELGSGKPWFVPLGIFVARKEAFDFILRSRDGRLASKDIAFTELPLIENGWDEGSTKIKRTGTTQDGFPIWRLTLG